MSTVLYRFTYYRPFINKCLLKFCIFRDIFYNIWRKTNNEVDKGNKATIAYFSTLVQALIVLLVSYV